MLMPTILISSTCASCGRPIDGRIDRSRLGGADRPPIEQRVQETPHLRIFAQQGAFADQQASVQFLGELTSHGIGNLPQRPDESRCAVTTLVKYLRYEWQQRRQGMAEVGDSVKLGIGPGKDRGVGNRHQRRY